MQSATYPGESQRGLQARLTHTLKTCAVNSMRCTTRGRTRHATRSSIAHTRNMIYRLTAIALAVTGVSAFAPARRGPSAQKTALDASVVDTLAQFEGPHFCWGSEGPTLDPPKDEGEIKGYHRYGRFAQACRDAGIQLPGEVTCFAPTDQAMENYLADGKMLTRELVLNHFVQGRVPANMISGDLQSLEGSVLKYERKFRKTFLNEAIIGQADNFGGGSVYPTDIPADNGVIHPIAQVLEPGFGSAQGGYGALQ